MDDPTALTSKKDFSFLGMHQLISFAALGMLMISGLGGVQLGDFFAMPVVLMGGYVLYYTSTIMRHFRSPRGRIATLFSTIATMFYTLTFCESRLTPIDEFSIRAPRVLRG